MRDRKPVGSFSLPKNWVGPRVDVINQETRGLKHDTGTQGALALILLSDGTNIAVVGNEKGIWALRMGPSTDWALQEHQVGRPPGVFRGVWRKVVKAQIEAKRMSGPPPATASQEGGSE